MMCEDLRRLRTLNQGLDRYPLAVAAQEKFLAHGDLAKQFNFMKLHLTFEEKDFENMRALDKAVKKQLGNNCYVGTNSLCMFFEYPKEMVAMLRPNPENKQFEFDLESSLPDTK